MVELVLRKEGPVHADVLASMREHRQGVQVQTTEGTIVTLNRYFRF